MRTGGGESTSPGPGQALCLLYTHCHRQPGQWMRKLRLSQSHLWNVEYLVRTGRRPLQSLHVCLSARGATLAPPVPEKGQGPTREVRGWGGCVLSPTVGKSVHILGFEQGVTVKTGLLDQSGEWEGLRPALLQIECACESPGTLLRCSI